MQGRRSRGGWGGFGLSTSFSYQILELATQYKSNLTMTSIIQPSALLTFTSHKLLISVLGKGGIHVPRLPHIGPPHNEFPSYGPAMRWEN